MALDQFALARQRAQQDANTQQQRNQDALKRRFAQLGNLNSGAQMKLERQAQTDVAKNLQSANETIDAQEQADFRRKDEIKQAQEFQRGERIGGQDFSAGQAALQRAYLTGEREAGQTFARGERLGGQDFASQQAAVQREFQVGERVAGQNFASGQAKLDRDIQEKSMAQDKSFRIKELNLARDQFNQNKNIAADDMKFRRDSLAQAKEQFEESMKLEKRAADSNERVVNDTIKQNNEKGFWDQLSYDIKNIWS